VREGRFSVWECLIFHRLELSNAKKLSTYRGLATARQRKVCVVLFKIIFILGEVMDSLEYGHLYRYNLELYCNILRHNFMLIKQMLKNL
jgi:hypothetical protein